MFPSQDVGHMFWSNYSIYSDLTRPHPKWWFSKGNPFQGNLGWWNIIFWPDMLTKELAFVMPVTLWSALDFQSCMPQNATAWYCYMVKAWGDEVCQTLTSDKTFLLNFLLGNRFQMLIELQWTSNVTPVAVWHAKDSCESLVYINVLFRLFQPM